MDRRDERILAWFIEKDLEEDIEDPSFRADDIESDQVNTVIISLTPNHLHRR